MHAITWFFVVLSAVVVFAIAAGVVGREAHRLDAVAPRVVYEIAEAVAFVSDNLPLESQARLTEDEVRQMLLAHLSWMSERDLMLADALDHVQDITTPLVVEDTTLTAYLLAEAGNRGVQLLDDVDVVYVVDAHMAYLRAIGAVGPQADSV